jgi:signal transduction histidine kinase/ActR/RegA family two-component response regulator
MEFSYDIDALNLFRNVFVFYGTMSFQGRVLSLEGKIFERTATEPQLLIGQKFSETVYWQSSADTAEKLEKAVHEAIQRGDTKASLDFRVNAAEKIFIELSLQVFADKQAGGERRIFFCAQEVTKRERQIKNYKSRARQLETAAAAGRIGLWFWEFDTDFFYATARCKEVFNSAPEDALSFSRFLSIVHPEDRESLDAALCESQAEGKEFSIDCRVIYSDNSAHWLALQGKTNLDQSGKPQNMSGAVRRVTEKKSASEELARVYEREKKARDEAEEANRAKDFFLAVVSHELRSPLNTILGWTKILLGKEIKPEARQNALETIEKSARAQSKLIDDLIDSARVASGKMRLEMRPVNLFEVLKTVYNSQKPLTESKNVHLEFAADRENISVFGDPIRLQQVFTNLVSNALKFTSADGNIKISARNSDVEVRVTVKDDGQGISPELLPNVFQQFKQGDEKTSIDRSGLGLGLSIVKILSEKHNGRIRAESEGIGRGSTFTVILPLCDSEIGKQQNAPVSAAEQTDGKSNRAEGKALRAVKILIVEDDDDSREVLQLFLEQSGARVKSVGSAAAAMNSLLEAAASEDLPDVIVSDLAMPDEDGYSLIERIRSLPPEKGGAIPAIALSAFAAPADKVRAFEKGFQKYHTKPFEADGIIQDILQARKYK